MIELTQFTVSGKHFTMNLLVLLIQSLVGVLMVYAAKLAGWIQLRQVTWEDCKVWFPISTMLVFVILTGSKAIVRVL